MHVLFQCQLSWLLYYTVRDVPVGFLPAGGGHRSVPVRESGTSGRDHSEITDHRVQRLHQQDGITSPS